MKQTRTELNSLAHGPLKITYRERPSNVYEYFEIIVIIVLAYLLRVVQGYFRDASSNQFICRET